MKDWTGNQKSTFSTLGASSHSLGERETNDYYATDPQTIDYLLGVESFNNSIWEPACGEGHLSKKLSSLGFQVKSSDLIDRGFGEVSDFLKQDTKFIGDIITNPPYKFAQEFCEKAIALSNNKVAMFLKLTFLEGQKRRKFFDKFPPKKVYIFSSRQKCAINGNFEQTGSSAAAYAWFVWYRDFKGNPTLYWI